MSTPGLDGAGSNGRRRLRRVLVTGGVVLATLAVGVVSWLVRSLHALERPEVQQALLARLRDAAGVDIRARKLEVSLFSGVRLEGVAVANPSSLAGDLLTAEELSLSYRLLPLLRGRLEVDAIAVKAPALRIVVDAAGRSNLDKLLARRGPATGGQLPAPVPLRLVVAHAAISDGTLESRDHRGRVMLAARDVEVSSAFEMESGSMTGRGSIALGAVSAAGATVTDVEAELAATRDLLHLSNLRGRLAGGRLAGEAKLHVPQGTFDAEVGVEDARVEDLAAQGSRTLAGRLLAHARLQGTSGGTLRGRGRADVADCTVKSSPVLRAVSTALRLPELANPDLERCDVDFQLATPRVTTPSLRAKGAAFDLSGSGTVNLDTRAIDYELVLALPHAVLQRVPLAESRSAFRDRGDGFATLAFRATGTTDAPKTDLASRLARGTAAEAVKKGFGRLLRGERPF